MHRISFNQIAIILLGLVMAVVSCREDSDDIQSYAYEDYLNFLEANSSLEGQFHAIWTAMNCNYSIWDYEEQHGVDWDRVYDEFLPRFKELDREYNSQNPVPDDLVLELYDKIFAPLHDGHLYMYLKNIHTGKRINESISPQSMRVIEDGVDDVSDFIDKFYLAFFKPTLKNYDDEGELAEYIQEDGYIFAHFKDGVVYLRVPRFDLSETFKNRNSDEDKNRICKLWEAWFSCIQRLQATDALKGLIIDVRSNLGGNANDYKYVLGALHNGNSNDGQYYKVGYYREKSGIGRLDFSRLYPFNLPIYKEHVNVEAPMVVLVNEFSASMAEVSSLAAKQLKNGYVIGTRTYGAFSPSADTYALTYAGDVGDSALADSEEKNSYFAPFFIHIPTCAFISLDNQFLDGIGVEPNETVWLDILEHMNNNKDNQLDRALEYIRTKSK